MATKTKISIIHPSRSRAEQAHKTCTNWLDKATNPHEIEYILSVDISDPDLAYYYGKFDWPTTNICVNDNKTAIEAINNAAKQATGNLLIVVSDDFDCPEHWDAWLTDALEGKEDFVVKTDNGLQPWIVTLPIMDRKYYERFGYIYYPGYNHLFCDTEMSMVGTLLGRTITLPIKFPHLHYSQSYGHKKDAINEKNDATWKQGEDLYIERVKSQFGLEGNFKADIPFSHIQWLKSKGVSI